MSEFGQGDWGGDYAYLESGRRRIADWGKDLPAGSVEGRGDSGRGRDGRQGHGSARRGPSKVEGLKRELERRGVEVEFMAEGMGRRKLNQSSWNPKYVIAHSRMGRRRGGWLMDRTQTLHLTIQLQIQQSLLGNAESLDSKTLNHLRVIYASPTAELPTLSSLVPPPIQAGDIVLLLPFHPSYANPTPIDILLRHPRPRLYFPPLTMDIGLEEAFRGMSWVEFPVLTVMAKGEWQKKMREGVVAVVPSSIGERGEKRKFDPTPMATDTPPSEGGEKKPKTSAGGGLAGLGDYDSASEGEVEEETEGLDLVGAEDDDGHGEGGQMVITQEDVEVLHALGAAAAADMA